MVARSTGGNKRGTIVPFRMNFVVSPGSITRPACRLDSSEECPVGVATGGLRSGQSRRILAVMEGHAMKRVLAGTAVVWGALTIAPHPRDFGRAISAEVGRSDTLCLHKVVPCNSAHLYSGSFSWQSALLGEFGQNRRSITVTVVKGEATCDGSETDVSISKVGDQTYTTTEVGTIKGPGLIAVEFDEDSAGALVYRVTGACPSPVWQASRQAPSRPAELGNSYYEQSYNQPATAIGIDLIGSRSEPHPDTDQENGVSGSIRVTWSLKRS